MGKQTDRIIADRMVVDALLMGVKAIINLSDEEIAQDYAKQSRGMTKERANAIREASLEVIRPVIEAVAKRGGIDLEFPGV